MWNSQACIASTRSCSTLYLERIRDRQCHSAGCRSVGALQASHGTLSVHERDVGDTLTAFVTGNATIEYNGSCAGRHRHLGVGGCRQRDVRHAAEQRRNGCSAVDLSSDQRQSRLPACRRCADEIKFVAEVSDGHGHTGSQPLTVTLIGAIVRVRSAASRRPGR